MPLNVKAAMALVRLAEARALEDLAEYVQKEARTRAPVRKTGRERKGRTRRLNRLSRFAAIRAAKQYYANDTFRRRQAVAYIEKYAVERIPRKTVKRQPVRIGTISEKVLGGGSKYASSKKYASEVIRPRRGTTVQRLSIVTRRGASDRRNPANKKGFELDAASMSKLSPEGRYEVRSGRAVATKSIERTVDENRVQTGVSVEIGGTLRESIAYSKPEETGRGMKVTITASAPYARYVEFPTSRTAAQPFLLPALKGAKRLALKRFDGALREQGLKGG